MLTEDKRRLDQVKQACKHLVIGRSRLSETGVDAMEMVQRLHDSKWFGSFGLKTTGDKFVSLDLKTEEWWIGRH